MYTIELSATNVDDLVVRNAGIIKDGKADYKALNEVLDLIIETVKKDEINRINYEKFDVCEYI